jgi:hypothetical protein
MNKIKSGLYIFIALCIVLGIILIIIGALKKETVMKDKGKKNKLGEPILEQQKVVNKKLLGAGIAVLISGIVILIIYMAWPNSEKKEEKNTK